MDERLQTTVAIIPEADEIEDIVFTLGGAGDSVTITEPKASFDPPADATWLLLVGDLTAVPAIARIAESRPELPTYVHAEVPDDLVDYLPGHVHVTWLEPPAGGQSALAATVEGIEWPAGPGYFWMAGESAQMRAIRKHLMRERGLLAGGDLTPQQGDLAGQPHGRRDDDERDERESPREGDHRDRGRDRPDRVPP